MDGQASMGVLSPSVDLSSLLIGDGEVSEFGKMLQAEREKSMTKAETEYANRLRDQGK
jgi:hypothetical protein